MGAIAPFGAFLAITALGQMLVIMTGGIDLSVPGTLTLGGVIMVGVGQQSNDRIVDWPSCRLSVPPRSSDWSTGS